MSLVIVVRSKLQIHDVEETFEALSGYAKRLCFNRRPSRLPRCTRGPAL
jgi:hypothetical protein